MTVAATANGETAGLLNGLKLAQTFMTTKSASEEVWYRFLQFYGQRSPESNAVSYVSPTVNP